MSLTVGWCSKRYARMTPSCPSSRKRSSGKLKRLTDVNAEGEKGKAEVENRS